ncbi:MAG: hypothetical protein K2X87_27930 [Gemmataceae bacterium]|nr:hypothetical protein [Gemmataceae bacterium]
MPRRPVRRDRRTAGAATSRCRVCVFRGNLGESAGRAARAAARAPRATATPDLVIGRVVLMPR